MSRRTRLGDSWAAPGAGNPCRAVGMRLQRERCRTPVGARRPRRCAPSGAAVALRAAVCARARQVPADGCAVLTGREGEARAKTAPSHSPGAQPPSLCLTPSGSPAVPLFP